MSTFDVLKYALGYSHTVLVEEQEEDAETFGLLEFMVGGDGKPVQFLTFQFDKGNIVSVSIRGEENEIEIPTVHI